jgi:hypothetical protein
MRLWIIQLPVEYDCDDIITNPLSSTSNTNKSLASVESGGLIAVSQVWSAGYIAVCCDCRAFFGWLAWYLVSYCHLTVVQFINVWARWADHEIILIVFDPRGTGFNLVIFIGSDCLSYLLRLLGYRIDQGWGYASDRLQPGAAVYGWLGLTWVDWVLWSGSAVDGQYLDP